MSDDITLSIGDLPAKGYASHGESWSLALALKLGGFALVRADGIEPVLVLDDVFSELDETRRERLAGVVADAEQVLITAAVGADVPDFPSARRFRVQGSLSARPPITAPLPGRMDVVDFVLSTIPSKEQPEWEVR